MMGQAAASPRTDVTMEQLEAMKKNEPIYIEWLEAQQTPGVLVKEDQMIFSTEAKRLISDEAYKAAVYPEAYTFIDVKKSLSTAEIQKAFWQMINLYPENKEDVLTYIYAFEPVFPTDEVTTSAFYTYAFFDPKITKIVDGKPDIYRPDLFENLLKNTKEIVSYIHYFRKEAQATKQ
jgi:hypothetical protein